MLFFRVFVLESSAYVRRRRSEYNICSHACVYMCIFISKEKLYGLEKKSPFFIIAHTYERACMSCPSNLTD